MKRGIAIDVLGKLLLGVALILVVAAFLWFFRSKVQGVVTWILDALRYGI